MALAQRVLDTIRRHALLRRGDRVLVALSGGPDSVALLRLLRELEAAGELTVAGRRAPQSRAARRGRTATSSSAARSRRSSGCRSARSWSTCARAPRGCGRRSRMPAGGRATSSSSASRPSSSADVDRHRPHARRSGRDVSAAPAARRGPARARRHSSALAAGSCVRCSTSAATSCGPIWRRAASRSETTRATAT